MEQVSVCMTMGQHDYIKDLVRHGLENNQQALRDTVLSLIEYSRKGNRSNLALHLQSILKTTKRRRGSSLTKVGSQDYNQRIVDKELEDIILERLKSDYSLDNIVLSDRIRTRLTSFIAEHRAVEAIQQHGLKVSNRILLHGPSGCGKTMASYVLSGELEKVLYVINLGAIVSSKLGETSKNIAKLFRKAAAEDCIVFLDEFDSLGKVRNYNQDHGEMKRVVNTILQLFDYLPENTVVIAATNQKEMLDNAIVRRFDSVIEFDLPGKTEIDVHVSKILSSTRSEFDDLQAAEAINRNCLGLSYYSIQKTLLTAIKQSLILNLEKRKEDNVSIDTHLWKQLVTEERNALIA